MHHHSPSRRAGKAAASQYGFRPREWSGQPLGVILTAYREAYGKSVEDVAQDLCIRRAHVRALEAEQYEALPELSYSAGFVRSYAKYLGLPPEEMVSRFRETYGQQTRVPRGLYDKALSPVATVPYSTRWPSFAVLAIAAVLLGSSYLVMSAYTAATNAPILAERSEAVIEIIRSEPISASTEIQSDVLIDEPIEISLEIGTLPVSSPSEGFIETVDVTAPTDQIFVYGVAIPPNRPIFIDQTPETLEAADRLHRVVIEATGRAYLTLADQQSGELFLRSEYQRGDKYVVPDGKIIQLISQNLDKLELIIDGTTYRVAPAIAALNEPLTLDPDTLPNSSQVIALDSLGL